MIRFIQWEPTEINRWVLNSYIYDFVNFTGDFFQLLFACCQESVFSVERFTRSNEQHETSGTGSNSNRRSGRGHTITPDFMWNITWLDFFKVRVYCLFVCFFPQLIYRRDAVLVRVVPGQVNSFPASRLLAPRSERERFGEGGRFFDWERNNRRYNQNRIPL